MRATLDQAPDGARDAFLTLAQHGAVTVESLLGRGWWGRGALPPPLDWLQRRGLVLVGTDGLLYPSDEAREGFLELTLDLAPSQPTTAPARVEPAQSVVIAESSADLDRAVAVPGAALRVVAPTVAVSERSPTAVLAALRAAGVETADDLTVPASSREPALPVAPEEAVGPRAVREVLARAVAESRQVRLQYFASSRGGAPTSRVVDPWRFADDLVVGYCHLRGGERTFAVDRIGRARLLPSMIEHTAPPD